jgi:hypothetical protein
MPNRHGELIYSSRQCFDDDEELGRVVRYVGDPLGKHHEQPLTGDRRIHLDLPHGR